MDTISGDLSSPSGGKILVVNTYPFMLNYKNVHCICVGFQRTVFLGETHWTGSSRHNRVVSAEKISIELLRRTLDPLHIGQVSLRESRTLLPCLAESGLKQGIKCLQNCSKAWKSKRQAELQKK